MKRIKFLLPILAATLILSVLFSRIDIGETYKVFDGSNKLLLLLSPLMLLTAHAVSAFRWKIILRMLGGEVNFKTILRLYLANIPITKILPLSSGDFMRVYYLKGKVPMAKHAGGIFLGMLGDVALLAILAMVGGVLLGEKVAYLSGITTLLLIITLYALTFIIGRNVPLKLRDKVQNFIFAFDALVKQSRFVYPIMASTVLNWFLVLIYIKLTFLAFNFNMPFLSIVAFVPIVTLVSFLPITVWGVGTRETAMLILFSGLAPGPVILAVGVTYSFIGAMLLPLLLVPLTYKTIREISR